MPQRVASLYAEIGADTSALKRGLADTKGQLQTTAKGFKDFTGGIIAGFGAAAGAVVAVKRVLDFGKEGAQLAYAQDRFDRLSMSIGVTSDKLMGDLRVATRGMRSDMELAASAADLMGLGLAKNYDEVIRLTRVAGALNMNMNQLVLTLTNQTTMRFDALGVSVDGFNEKVKELEDAGMSAGDAFKEAFLQQAEEQITKVGDAADSTVGKFARMDAAVKNAGDAIKTSFAPVIANAADAIYYLLEGQNLLDAAMEEHGKNVLETSVNYEEYRTEMQRALELTGVLADKNGLVIVGYDEMGRAVTNASMGLQFMSEEAYNAAKADQALVGDIQAANAELARRAQAEDEAAAAANRHAEATRGVALSLQEVTAQSIASAALQELNDEWEAGNLEMPEYKQLFANIASEIAGLPPETVNAQLAMFELMQSFDDNSKSIQQNITDAYLFKLQLDQLPNEKYIDIHVRYDTIGAPPGVPGVPGAPSVPPPQGGPQFNPTAPEAPGKPGGPTIYIPNINIWPTEGMSEIDIGGVVVKQIMDIAEADRGGAFAGIGYAG